MNTTIFFGTFRRCHYDSPVTGKRSFDWIMMYLPFSRVLFYDFRHKLINLYKYA